MEARFSAPVQTGPGPHPASCTMGTGSFPGVKSGRGVPLTPHPLLVPWSTPPMGRTACTEPQCLYKGALIKPLNPELNPICYLLALLGVHHFLHVSRIRVKLLTFRLLMSYVYTEHPFLMFLDHTQRRSTVGRTPLDE